MVLEAAEARRTGNVSTAEITDATPAALDPHISCAAARAGRHGDLPDEKKLVGGPGSIAEQTVDTGRRRARRRRALHQMITGGPDAGKTVKQSVARQGKQVTDAAGLAALPRRRTAGARLFNAGP